MAQIPRAAPAWSLSRGSFGLWASPPPNGLGPGCRSGGTSRGCAARVLKSREECEGWGRQTVARAGPRATLKPLSDHVPTTWVGWGSPLWGPLCRAGRSGQDAVLPSSAQPRLSACPGTSFSRRPLGDVPQGQHLTFRVFSSLYDNLYRTVDLPFSQMGKLRSEGPSPLTLS